MGGDSEKCSQDLRADLDLLLAARHGDHEDGRLLVSRHGASMIRTAWRVLGSYGGAEAEDVVQEAFVAALTTSALPTGDVGAWLRAVTARKALDWLRMVGRRREQPGQENEPKGALPPDRPDSGVVDVLAVRQALNRLSASDRAVLTLVDLEGLSMAEAAQILGLTRVAVKLRAVRARRKLARILSPGIG